MGLVGCGGAGAEDPASATVSGAGAESRLLRSNVAEGYPVVHLVH